MIADPGSLREQVRNTYSRVASSPTGEHPFRVGRKVAERAGYPAERLSGVPAASVEAFAGVSCLPCFTAIPDGARVLDVGCGAGLDSLLVAAKAGRVLGIDFSQDMLSRAQGAASAMRVTNVEFWLGDAEAIPAATGSFDVALVNGIFNLNQTRRKIFSELVRVVRTGGQVFAAELVLKGPLPADVRATEADWFA
jgi:SAM-dependent methyltransferase